MRRRNIIDLAACYEMTLIQSPAGRALLSRPFKSITGTPAALFVVRGGWILGRGAGVGTPDDRGLDGVGRWAVGARRWGRG